MTKVISEHKLRAYLDSEEKEIIKKLKNGEKIDEFGLCLRSKAHQLGCIILRLASGQFYLKRKKK